MPQNGSFEVLMYLYSSLLTMVLFIHQISKVFHAVLTMAEEYKDFEKHE